MPKTKPYTLRSVNRYRLSPKGQETKRKYVEQNKEVISEYNKKYQVTSRQKMKELGYCFICRLRPGKKKRVLNSQGRWVQKTLTICEVCSERQRVRKVLRRQKNENKVGQCGFRDKFF